MKNESAVLESIAVQRRKRRLKGTHSRDRLSGLLNSRAARKYISAYLKKMGPDDISAMFLIDVDDFRRINGDFGYLAGNYALQRAGELLSALFRASDIVCRLGGDEYLVFMSGNITKDEVWERADKICQEVQFPIGSQQEASVTVSVGVCAVFGKGMDFEKVYTHAAAALETARQKGGGSFYVVGEGRMKAKLHQPDEFPWNLIQPDCLLKYMIGGLSILEAGQEIRVIYANQGFFDMADSGASFSLPCTLKEAGIHPDYEEEYEQLIRTKADSGGTAEHVHPVSRTGKDWRWRHVKLIPLHRTRGKHPVLLMELSTDISQLMESERRLNESNERLRTVIGQKTCLVWEVDIRQRSFHVFDVDTQSCADQESGAKFPDAFLKGKIVHDDSAANFREFAEDILNGKTGGTGNFIMWDKKDGCYCWFLLSYRMIYDRDKTPVKAIGVQERLPLPGTGFYGRPLPEILRHHLVARLKVNLTKDSIENVWKEGMDHTLSLKGRKYTETMEKEPLQLFVKSEETEFTDHFKRDTLLAAFEKGEWWFNMEYRRVDSGGNIRWMSETVNLIQDEETKDVYMYACFNDSQQRHNWEMLLGADTAIEKDAVSGLYDAPTMKKLINKLISTGKGTQCALVVIQMGGSFGRMGEAGLDYSQKRKHFLAVALSLALGPDCLAGQYREDKVLVFVPDAGSRSDIKRRFDDAFSYIHTSMDGIGGIEGIRFIAGVVTSRIEEADYGELLMRSSYLCEAWEDSAEDTVAFLEGDEDWNWIRMKMENEPKEGVALQPKDQKELSRDEQSAAFQCITAMLAADSLKDSIENALRCMGSYYQASRVYILDLSEDRKTVNMSYEWNRQGRQSIRQVMEEMEIGKIPLLGRCMREEKPVLIENKTRIFKQDGNRESWFFCAYPLKNGQDISGFLCIENPQKYREDIMLPEAVLPYIIKEKQRFRAWAQEKKEEECFLDTLPNLRAYMDVIHTLDSDTYSSMGALSVDIPNFSALNSTRGFDYGQKLLGDIAETLKEIFGKTFIFRTWDAEFVVLYPNTILEVFIGRCTRLRNTLQRRYPKQLRIGYTWSEGLFSARNLVKEAQSIMRCENVREEEGDREAFLDKKGFDMEKTAAERNFIAYFQPKINMRDGSLVGAEALVRGIDGNGNIIPPGQFIETLEKSGDIRELDLYMLEFVLEQLSEWKAKGLPAVKVSVNLSRYSLLNPTTLASILAIQSHYPDIPPDQIELEITETACDMEKTTLSGLIDSFREYGLEFELDDFGSHYANMSIFTNIKFKIIKLDRSLVSDLPGNEMSRMLVEDIVKICHSFGMLCVAEGVETKQQKEALLKAGCCYGQGFYYSRPLPPGKFEEQYLIQKEEV